MTPTINTAEVWEPPRPEEWRPVNAPGFEGIYEVSDLGRVRSLPRVIRQRNRWGWCEHTRPGRTLKPVITGTGYRQVGLCKDGVQKVAFVHRLVLEAFAGPCPEGQEALHGPGGSLDNRWPENLQWGTHSTNMGPDRLRDGTQPDVRAEKHPQAKLNYELAREIRSRYQAGETQRAIAESLGVSGASVSRVCTGRLWSDAA
jgi:NUMOD4 motif/HNH endonuclease